MSFSELGLVDALLRAVRDQGYEIPSPVQRQAIPAVLTGRDVMAAAQTGTGKTAGFTLPLLQRLAEKHVHAIKQRPVALVLTPTRELAAQVGEAVVDYGRHLKLSSTIVFGGVNIKPQIAALARGVHVLIATPGRLLDLVGQRAVDLGRIEILVLDEADRMLDMGFIHDIRRILALLPKKRQNLLFSATFSPEIRKLAGGFLSDPIQIDVSPKQKAAETVDQCVYSVDQTQKAALLARLIHDGDWPQVLIFTRTKHGANRLAQKLEKDGIRSAAIHGNKSQGARTRALADFKKGAVRALVATDIAARGLDIEELPWVVNFELPNVPEDYVHRIGRTGRAGATGQAISLVSREEKDLLVDIERLLKRKLPGEVVKGFEPGSSANSPQPDRDQNRRSERGSARHDAHAHPAERGGRDWNRNGRGRRPAARAGGR